MNEENNQEQPSQPIKEARPSSETPTQAPIKPIRSKKKILVIIVTIVSLLIVAVILILIIGSESSNNSISSTDSANVVGQTSAPQTDIKEAAKAALNYAIVNTNQEKCYSNSSEMTCPKQGAEFYGQDAQYSGNTPSYTDNNDGTITDNNTGLMWQKTPGTKTTYSAAIGAAETLNLAGHSDWRPPSIKELYSLMDFRGTDPDPMGTSTTGLTPFIDDAVFDFEYGDTSSGSRIIDSQWVTSNVYEATVMGSQECFFGVNFADGRIKCYPTESRQNQGYFTRYVRGDTYGTNDFNDNDNGTITDSATGLMWQQADSGSGMNWSDSLSYCENLSLADSTNWRLPNAKELHSILDYSRSPDTTNSPAIDSVFKTTSIVNEANKKDWPFFWSSTTHKGQAKTDAGAYLVFGRGMGNMSEFGGWIDVHGAGSQRSDPKSGDPRLFSDGRGPQGDAIRILNYARCINDVQ